MNRSSSVKREPTRVLLPDGRSWPSLRSMSMDFGLDPSAATQWLRTNPGKSSVDLVTFWEGRGYLCGKVRQ